MISPDLRCTPPTEKHDVKLAVASSRRAFTICFAISSAIFRGQQFRFKSRWCLSAHTGNSFHGVTILYDHSKFSLFVHRNHGLGFSWCRIGSLGHEIRVRNWMDGPEASWSLAWTGRLAAVHGERLSNGEEEVQLVHDVISNLLWVFLGAGCRLRPPTTSFPISIVERR